MEKTGTKKKRPGIDRAQVEWQAMVIPGMLFLLIFNIFPLFGLIAAFKDFRFSDGFFLSPWATDELGNFDPFKYFKVFFEDPMFFKVLENTILINLINLAVGFPAPILLALLFHELKSKHFSRTVQTISYLPNFISWIVYGSMVICLLDPNDGAVNLLLKAMHLTDSGIDFVNETQYTYLVVVVSGLLKGLGWGTVIYTASLTGVNESLIEYATLEGANRAQKIWHVYLPAIRPLITLYFIFALPGIFGSNFDQMFILKNNLNAEKSNVLATYIYQVCFQENDISKATAIGMMQSALGLILVLSANQISKKLSGRSIY